MNPIRSKELLQTLRRRGATLTGAIAIGLLALVFAFAALWFAHYALAALERRRRAEGVPPGSFVAEGPAAAPTGSAGDASAVTPMPSPTARAPVQEPPAP